MSDMPKEADIVINGRVLSYGESMAVRCALTSFFTDLNQNGLGDDQLGKDLTEAYKKNIKSVLYTIHMNCF